MAPLLVWPEEENALLKSQAERAISFEAIAASIAQGGLLDVLAHPNRERYPDQKILVVQIRDYVYAVPSVEQAKGTWFLKTAFPSRRLTKLYATSTGR